MEKPIKQIIKERLGDISKNKPKDKDEVIFYGIILLVSLAMGFLVFGDQIPKFVNTVEKSVKQSDFQPNNLFSSEEELNSFIEMQRFQLTNIRNAHGMYMTPDQRVIFEANKEATEARLKRALRMKELGYDPDPEGNLSK